MLMTTFLLLTVFGLVVCTDKISQSGTDTKWDIFRGHTNLQTNGGGSSRIVGGSDTTIEEYPHQVWIEFNYGGVWYFICGGSIIDKNWILTAAHCVDGYPPELYRIVAGTADFTSPDPVIRNVVAYYKHYDYCVTNPGYEHDMAVVKLGSSLTFGPKVNKIDLAERDDFAGDTCDITGWGRLYGFGSIADVLQVAQIPVLSNEDCTKKWNDISGAYISDNHICVHGDDKSSCNGDSGGPLTCKSGHGSHVLAGVTSWGIYGCDPLFPSVYVRVSQYSLWIKFIKLFH